MSLRFAPLVLGGAAALTAALVMSNDAHACGGCFHEANPPQPETTVVTGHRMAFSISPARTVLWDQIKYSGTASDFAWVLPVKAGAYVEASSDAWFEALDAATSTHVVPPALNCVSAGDFDEGSGSGRGCGCFGASYAGGGGGSGGGSGGSGGPGSPPPPVTVTHQGSIGPYETVTLHANVKDALPTWLTTHGYAIDPAVQPIINAYVSEGFDFIALRLKPGAGIQQMKPVRVVSSGASPTLPLRMVAAGTGAHVDITLFVIGEGRWEADKSFPNSRVDPKNLIWDFNTNASNFALLRQLTFASGDGRSWLTAYSKLGALLSPINNPTTSLPVQYTAGQFSPKTIAELYVFQGMLNGETSTVQCTGAFQSYNHSGALVVDVCPGPGGGGAGGGGGGGAACGMAPFGELDSRIFACDKLDDLSVALVGMHPRDVWLTRLESNLPHSALNIDLNLQASVDTGEIENWLTATTPVNPPCELAAGPIEPTSSGGKSSRRRTDLALFAAALAALGAALARRAQPRRRSAES